VTAASAKLNGFPFQRAGALNGVLDISGSRRFSTASGNSRCNRLSGEGDVTAGAVVRSFAVVDALRQPGVAGDRITTRCATSAAIRIFNSTI
jgi:hypothetical protein